jgi:hypothetical protein
MKKTSAPRVVTAGGGVPSTSTKGSALIGVISNNNRGPSDKWKTVEKADIGKGFVPIELVTPQIVEKRLRDEKPLFKNKFLLGSSRFIWFVVVPKVEKVEKKKPKVALNYKNKLDKKTKGSLVRSLDKNVEETVNFIMKDILPVTLAYHTAMDKVDEYMLQFAETKAEMPKPTFEQKMKLAVHLRITRFLSEQFKLTSEEKKMMNPELTKPWIQS